MSLVILTGQCPQVRRHIRRKAGYSNICRREHSGWAVGSPGISLSADLPQRSWRTRNLTGMGFSVSNLGLALSVTESLREIHQELFRASRPLLLHQYTRNAEVVGSIVQSRCLWATCIADQADQYEISHATQIVKTVVERMRSSDVPKSSMDILLRLPAFMDERKNWMFIACFCDDHDSELHWHKFGDFRMSFPGPGAATPVLTLPGLHGEHWYQPVVYDEDLQLDGMERAIRSIFSAISIHSAEGNSSEEGPWRGSILDFCARNIAQLLLKIAVGFKRKSFRGEKEWRIVCAPPLGVNSSAPSLLDERFAGTIRRDPRRHVPLQILLDERIFNPSLRPPVPFFAWACNPSRFDRAGVAKINDILRTNQRSDLAAPV